MASRSSSFATAFLWAVSMGAGYGIIDGLIAHEDTNQVENNVFIAATASGAAAYGVRRRSPS